jgi:hypothetical protein
LLGSIAPDAVVVDAVVLELAVVPLDALVLLELLLELPQPTNATGGAATTSAATANRRALRM